ncbi:MAG TPA: CoA transferase [Ilumatobacteraceae bacterium]|nr:CoA transferase [Ilumatobacteraceae bacterium]
MTGNGPRPLEGVRVLDLTRVLAGPHAARMLCDLGAEVIKVEPPEGDITRTTYPRINSISGYFAQQNGGKRCISIDLDHQAGRDLLMRLADVSDVLVENFRPGVMDRLGMGPDVLRARNPRLIFASVSGYGQTGPWVHRRAYAPVVGAESGFTKAQGDAGRGHYANDPHSHADVYTAVECGAAILAALYQRERTGVGDRIDIAMAQTMLYVNEHAADHLWDGDVPEGVIRSFRPMDYPVLTAANGEMVVISGHPAENVTFDFYMAAIGRLDEVRSDPRFADTGARLAHLDVIHQMLIDWGRTIADAEAIEDAMSQHRLAVGRLRSVHDVCETDWADERGAVVEMTDRGDGTIRVPNTPWKFAGSDVRTGGAPRYRGEDNRAVLSEVLGLTDAQLDTLEADGVLTSRLPRR